MLESSSLQNNPPGSLGVKRSRLPDQSPDSHPSILSRRTPSTAAPHRQADNNAAHSVMTSFSPPTGAASGQSSGALGASSFRNVSACNRCRLRKNRCDQRLPRCQACEKAGVKCVGYDPITKREIPRSYVYFLEARVTYLEKLLLKNGLEFKPSAAFDGEAEGREKTSELESAVGEELSNSTGRLVFPKDGPKGTEDKADSEREGGSQDPREADGKEQLDKLVSNIGMVSVQGTSDPRYLGSTSGISFARLVFAAVKSSVNHNGSERSAVRPPERRPSNAGGSTMRDSFFGLQARPSMRPAAFPDRELAVRLVDLYFEHANPQMPILHRGDFMELLARAYHTEETERAPRDQYLLNIVFAIGAGIIFEGKGSTENDDKRTNRNKSPPARSSKKQKRSSHQYQPEEYHASAVLHLETFLGTSPTSEGFGAGLEELQAVLLLASFALLRPVSPGLWYIVGVAVRLAIDLGLHHEDGTGIDSIGEDGVLEPPGVGDHGRSKLDPRERGRIEWARDSRRRLWWCVYSFDRLVSTCVGRPFGITDQVVTTEFPSMLDDAFITKTGFVAPPPDAPSYKQVSYHYLKLRLLQSEIQQVLQYQQARYVRQNGKNSRNPYMHTTLPSPFLERFDSFRSWRRDVHRRLWEWKESSPTQQQTGVRFSIEFFELNYYQALIMLYRQSLTVPAALAGELTPTEDISSPPSFDLDEREDEDDIYLQIAEAGQKVIKIYRQQHRVRLVNYTYLATHHLFMAGISFLYAIWHSPVVRSRLTLDDVDFTVLAATSIMGDLMEKCPPAEACRDAFERMSRATVRMGSSGFASQTVGGGSLSTPVRSWPSSSHSNPQSSRADYRQNQVPSGQRRQSQRQNRPPPQFDMNLNDLFSQVPPSQRPPPATRQRSSQSTRPSYTAQQTMQSESSHEPYSSHAPYAPALNSYDQSPSQQQQQFVYANSPQSISSGGAVQSFTPPLNPDQRDLSDVSLDLLDFTNMNQNPETTVDGNPPFNQMDMPSFGQGPQGTGLNMGFGMEVDYLRDISDVNGYDLMDGYWFGMPNANPGV